jgi:glycosyltransferase involved in cell wall biosynthesis
MACGLVTIDYRHKDNVNERVIELLDEIERKKEGEENRQFIIDNHDRKKVIEKLLNIYRKQRE